MPGSKFLLHRGTLYHRTGGLVCCRFPFPGHVGSDPPSSAKAT